MMLVALWLKWNRWRAKLGQESDCSETRKQAQIQVAMDLKLASSQWSGLRQLALVCRYSTSKSSDRLEGFRSRRLHYQAKVVAKNKRSWRRRLFSFT